MKFFLDTANLKQIQEVQNLGILDGVTTNPSLIAKEGVKGDVNIKQRYIDICNLVDGDVSAEVIATDFEEIIKEGEELAKLHHQIIVKVPMIKEGIKAINYFSKNGIKTNCTLIFSAGQALLAAKAGATYISPFIGRLDDIGESGIDLITQICNIFKLHSFDTQVLAASIRSKEHIIQCAEAGADVVTTPLAPIFELLKHDLTDKGLTKFLEDHAKNNS